MAEMVDQEVEMKATEVLLSQEDLETKLRKQLEVEYQARLEVQVKEISDKLTEENKKTVQEAIEKFRKEMGPPSDKDIQKLIDQEYVEFEVEVPCGRKYGEGKTKKFMIRELPQAIEKKMLKKIKEILVPVATDLASITLNLMEGDASKKLVQIMNTFEPMLDVMATMCTLSLNPFGEDNEINEEWVVTNLSSSRIANIVTAQMTCNKVRDFLSLLFQGVQLVK